MEKKDEIIEVYNEDDIAVTSVKVGGLIHIIRGKQVILDSDLAMLYQVDTGALNRAVKRNKKRFPDDFCFQLTEEELLRCQNGISKKDASEGRGGRRYMPYAFTEQGISMLSAILRSDVAINVSIGIMRAFVEMRKFLATNSLILNRIDDLEVKQLQYQKSTDERFDKVFQYIEDHARTCFHIRILLNNGNILASSFEVLLVISKSIIINVYSFPALYVWNENRRFFLFGYL